VCREDEGGGYDKFSGNSISVSECLCVCVRERERQHMFTYEKGGFHT